jgi:hypothetical protein
MRSGVSSRMIGLKHISTAGFLFTMVLAIPARAQLTVAAEERGVFVSFAESVRHHSAAGVSHESFKFDFKIEFLRALDDSAAPAGLVAGEVSGALAWVNFRPGTDLNSLLSPDLDANLLTASTPAWRFNLDLGEAPPIPEPSTYGFLGAMALLGLAALHRLRTKSASLAM